MKIHWLPLTADLRYNREVARVAGQFGCGSVQFSHTICHHADDLLDNPARADHARKLFEIYSSAGLDVWCWTHEFRKPSARHVTDGKLDVDHPELYEHLHHKYDRFFRLLPGIQGLILTFAETDYSVYQDRRIRSFTAREQRVARLVGTMLAICNKHGKRLAIRDFVYRNDEVHTMLRTIRELPREVIVMSKSVPHDWQPFYPHNPVIGQVAPHEQWVEFDAGHEYEGQHLYPYVDLYGTLEKLHHARASGCGTACVRLDRYSGHRGQSAICTLWGQLELMTFKQFAEDPSDGAARAIQWFRQENFYEATGILDAAYRAVTQSLFPMRFWMADHSRLPTFDYARTHIIDGNADRLPAWSGLESDREAEQLFRQMPREWMERCIAEGDGAVRAAQDCRKYLAQAKAAGRNLDKWRQSIDFLEQWMQLFCAYKHAFFRIRHVQEHPGAIAGAEISRAIDRLEELCQQYSSSWVGRELEGRPIGLSRPPVGSDNPEGQTNASGPFAHVILTLRRELALLDARL